MKITQEQQKQGQEFIHELVEKAWKDHAFKKELVANPNTTIEKLTGKALNIPENIRIVIEDQTNPSVVYLNIPRKIEIDDLELTDEQLELVAGGELAISGTAIAIVAGVTLVSAAVGVGVGYWLAK